MKLAISPENPQITIDVQNSRYPIRTVATLTGVNPITLRAWERRYNLLKPARTSKGHRLYSQNDIDLIYQVTGLLDKGIPISQVPQALEKRQEKLSQEGNNLHVEDIWSQYRQRMVTAISRFDERELDQIYNDALSLYPIDVTTYSLILPLLNLLGRRWQTAEGSVAEEHFFSVFLRNKIGARFHHRIPLKRCIRLVAACLPNERHEIGLLLFALSAHALGYDSVILGADMPFDDLPLVLKRSRCHALILSSSVAPPNHLMSRDLSELVAKVNVPVFIGGCISVQFRDDIIRAGAIPLGDDIQQGLKYLEQYLELDKDRD